MPPKAASKRLTHFLCIPLVTARSRPQLEKSLQAFRADVKDDRTPENLDGIPEKAIRPPGTLHLTLGVMSLLTQEQVNGALALLSGLDLASFLPIPIIGLASDENAKNPTPRGENKIPGLKTESETKTPSSKTEPEKKPLKVTLQGLRSMHAPNKTSILYSSPLDPDDRLYQFCTKLRDAFSDFLVPDTRPLLLHATILNTVYVPGVGNRSGRSGASHGKNRAKMTIDARELLERYRDVTWMEDVRVEKVAICRMGASSIKDAEGVDTGDEEYFVEGKIDFPMLDYTSAG